MPIQVGNPPGLIIKGDELYSCPHCLIPIETNKDLGIGLCHKCQCVFRLGDMDVLTFGPACLDRPVTAEQIQAWQFRKVRWVP